MRIICDKCENHSINSKEKNTWLSIEARKMGCIVEEYYLCPDCENKFYEFIDKKEPQEET